MGIRSTQTIAKSIPSAPSSSMPSPVPRLTVKITKNGTRSLPSGELIIEPSWDYTKDKIVGVMLAKDFRQVIPALLISGTILVLPAAVVLLRRFRRY
jgi:hypothetical protein